MFDVAMFGRSSHVLNACLMAFTGSGLADQKLPGLKRDTGEARETSTLYPLT